MSFTNCEHDAPTDYCGICNTKEELEELSTTMLDCYRCFDGREMEVADYETGDFREITCKMCGGTSTLTWQQSLARHKFLIYYWSEEQQTKRKQKRRVS